MNACLNSAGPVEKCPKCGGTDVIIFGGQNLQQQIPSLGGATGATPAVFIYSLECKKCKWGGRLRRDPGKEPEIIT